ncbi:tRNA (adenosine(37)-N6)-threonylcarbamoyltransferase complex dimerization subunit type 1 TsaB [Gammaproteobacteria bacterium AS21]
MAKILALDTSTDACSVALHIDGESHEIFKVVARKHTHELLPMVQELLAQAQLSVAQLDAIAFGRGPGSFAGIRIATGVAQGLAFAADLGVIPISSLAALAQGYYREKNTELSNEQWAELEIVTAFDARMNELYWGSYCIKEGTAQLVLDERVGGPDHLLLNDNHNKYIGVGSGFNYLASMNKRTVEQLTLIESSRHPHSQDIVAIAHTEFLLGNMVDAAAAQPVYLRNQVTWKKKDQQ